MAIILHIILTLACVFIYLKKLNNLEESAERKLATLGS